MPKQPKKLTAKEVNAIKKRGWHRVDANLYLQVTKAGNRSWLFRYRFNDQARSMGLGACADMLLADATEKAAELRKLVNAKIDPYARREASEAEARQAVAKGVTFQQCAQAYIDDHELSWRNPKHRQQWRNTLEQYVYPVFGKLSVQDVDTGLVMKVLQPMWREKNETASRIRGRIEIILDWAKTREYRQGENPARWRGHLENLLPKRSLVHTLQHHPALQYSEIYDFIQAIPKDGSAASKALLFTILTGARTSETIKARWSEINFKESVWTVPEERMKAKRLHRVTLSEAAVHILRDMLLLKKDDEGYVFPGRKNGKALSNGAMLMLRKRMGYVHVTVHGFRSTFRDWAADCTSFHPEVVEAAIAHIVGDKTEAAYKRTDFLSKRRLLMNAWAQYCDTSQPAETCGATIFKIGTGNV